MDDVRTVEFDHQALRLATAVSKLRSGLRAARWEVTDLSMTQIAILRYLDRNGAATASALAAAEHISPQAVAQQLRRLNKLGYIRTEPDTGDRRKISILLTGAGQDLLQAVLESRENWLAAAIVETIDPQERVDLERAIVILERLVDRIERPRRSQEK